jgi:hypothetical protein
MKKQCAYSECRKPFFPKSILRRYCSAACNLKDWREKKRKQQKKGAKP